MSSHRKRCPKSHSRRTAAAADGDGSAAADGADARRGEDAVTGTSVALSGEKKLTSAFGAPEALGGRSTGRCSMERAAGRAVKRSAEAEAEGKEGEVGGAVCRWGRRLAAERERG